jgi:catechol 2,3-dioxygenase-like lactoylglutathione lyase family enzyme
MRFGHLELAVTSPRESAAFYRDRLGFRVVSEQGPYVWIERGGIEILLRPRQGGGAEPSLVFYTGDPAAESAKVAAAGGDIGKHGTCWHVRDPDGNLVQIVDPTDDHSGP